MKKTEKLSLTYYLIKRSVATLSILLLHSPLAFATLAATIPNAPQLDAAAYILMDAKSGTILVQHHANTKRDPASLTKMMTSYVVGKAIESKQIDNHDLVSISQNAWALGNPILKGSSVMFLKPGDKVSVADLNRGIIIQSGNDACIAMAEYIAGNQDNFVNMMNNYAQKLGLKNTHFQTVHGLDAANQYTTARDMALLGKIIIDELPNEYRLYKEKYFTYNHIRQINRNGLLWDRSMHVDGIKTGHTNSAGYNLVASAVRDNTRLISVVLGGKTFKGREEESRKLLNWGFRLFETITPLRTGHSVANKRIWLGKQSEIELGSSTEVNLTIPKGQKNNVKIHYKIDQSYLTAPINKGQQVGTIQFILDNKIIAKAPLTTLQTVKQAEFFSRLWDYISLKLHQWLN